MQASNLAPATFTQVSIQAISKNGLLAMQQAGATELLHEIMGYDNPVVDGLLNTGVSA